MPALFEKPDLFNQQDDLVDAIYRAGTKPRFQVGTKIVDRSGYSGTIVNVTCDKGSIWYDVRFQSGVAVRFESEIDLPVLNCRFMGGAFG